ncbi:DUF4124 domain-containing protein [Nitratidesulfovibrio sp.]|uniref:DUF4124 domain-containing protein n=1 Tax=Nitratidesulfovibrio sp. TaxID=2802297 RepID=UPI00333FF2CB
MFSLRRPGAPLAALLVAGLLVAPGVALGGKVYIWTDEKGVKHITDKPPVQAPADMKSLSATPNEARPGAPDTSNAPAQSEDGVHVVDGVLMKPDGQPVRGPDGQPVHVGPDGQPLQPGQFGQPGQLGVGADGQLPPSIQSAPDPKAQEREALQHRLEELQKEKEAYDLDNRRARAKGDGYAKQRSRYHQNEVEGRINEVESRLKLLDADGESSAGEGGQ